MEEFSKDYNAVKSSAIHDDQLENFDDFENQPVMEPRPVKEIKPGLIAGTLVILTLTGLFFTITNWFDALKIPFARNASLANANINSSLDLTNNDVANVMALKEKDTDQDGLSDYDELYLYKTSPYIPDSDSDGYADGEEIKNGQDPNCPAGISCASITLPANTQLSPEDLPDELGALTPEQIRGLLRQSGVSEQELQAVSDEELVSSFTQILLEQQGASTGQNQNDTGLEGLKPADYEAITPAQIRMMLQEQGISEQDLNNLTDDDLRQLWAQVIEDSAANQ
ncbi:MAG: hypothetical protein Q8P32_01200 [Candidatus Komeilibacteria bacterium]|nr:hypothetical protein [Candidatus Komeilibacteria bacterium]